MLEFECSKLKEGDGGHSSIQKLLSYSCDMLSASRTQLNGTTTTGNIKQLVTLSINQSSSQAVNKLINQLVSEEDKFI